MQLYSPTRILIGENIIKENYNLFNLGKSCLILTSPSAAIKSGALDDVIETLNKLEISYKTYSKVEQNPSVNTCIEVGKQANNYKAEFIIGIGGGSVLDATKTASLVATNPNLTEKDIYNTNWDNKPLPTILIGTTAGTGSEVTNVSVMTTSKKIKKSIHHDDLFSKYSFGDYRYIKSLPLDTLKSTAIDALCHLVESYFNNNSNNISKAYAIEGTRILLVSLKKIFNEEELSNSDYETLYNASILGGYAINITGTAFPHALGYYLTENYNIPHGIASATFLNSLIDYELINSEEYSLYFFNTIEMDPDIFKYMISALIGIKINSLSQNELDEIVKRYKEHTSLKNTYGNITIGEIEKIIISIFNIVD